MAEIKHQKLRKKKSAMRIVIPVLTVLVVVFVSLMVWLIMSEDSLQTRKRKQVVTLLKPPPPPKKMEKPPEPEIKKEEIIEPEPEPETPDNSDIPEDESQSVDDLLGLDADASGSDSFGLRAKKGGRSIIGGGDGRYRWYTGMIQQIISDTVKKALEKDGGLPKGTVKALVRIVLDNDGGISSFKLLHSSGDKRMDAAVLEALATVRLNELPPMDMPRALKFRIISKGKT